MYTRFPGSNNFWVDITLNLNQLVSFGLDQTCFRSENDHVVLLYLGMGLQLYIDETSSWELYQIQRTSVCHCS